VRTRSRTKLMKICWSSCAASGLFCAMQSSVKLCVRFYHAALWEVRRCVFERGSHCRPAPNHQETRYLPGKVLCIPHAKRKTASPRTSAKHPIFDATTGRPRDMFSARTKPRLRHQRRHHDMLAPLKRNRCRRWQYVHKCTHEESCRFLAVLQWPSVLGHRRSAGVRMLDSLNEAMLAASRSTGKPW